MSDIKNLEPYNEKPVQVPPSERKKIKRAEESPTRPNRGCVPSIALYCSSATVLMCLITSAFGYFGIGQAGTSGAHILDRLNELFGIHHVSINVVQVVEGFREQSFLETVREQQTLDLTAQDQVRLGKIIGLPATREMTYRAFVTISAGIDLRLLKEGDISFDGSTMTIHLPQPQIKDCILDLQKSYYIRNYYCSTVGICDDLEKILQSQVIQTASTEGTDIILEHASANATTAVKEIAAKMGYPDVRIEYTDASLPLVADGGTCVAQAPTPTPSVTP